MTSITTTILVLGGAGAQNSAVVRQLSENKSFHIKLLSRNANGEECLALSAMPNVSVLQGSCFDESTLIAAFKDIDSAYVNTDGFAVGEKVELYWGIRIYEMAYMAGVKHFVYSTLPYVSKGYGFDPNYRVPMLDGKGKVVEYLKSQPTDKMNWSVLGTAPYAETLFESWFPTKHADGTYIFWLPIGHEGTMPFLPLSELGLYSRYLFEHPNEFSGRTLSVAAEHATGDIIAKAFRAATGKPARFEPLSIEEALGKWPADVKVGAAGSPGYDDPTLSTIAGHFGPFLRIFSETRGNQKGGLWYTDYEILDKIHPGRVRTIEQWMKSAGYDGDKTLKVLKRG